MLSVFYPADLPALKSQRSELKIIRMLGFKNRMIGWLMLYVSIGFIPLAFSGELIRPFFLTPDAEVEKYNYAANVVRAFQPIMMLYVIIAMLNYIGQVNIDERVNEWLRCSIADIKRVVFAVLLYRIKELADYLVFENVVPACFSPFWFLIFWELIPIAILMLWAVVAPRLNNK